MQVFFYILFIYFKNSAPGQLSVSNYFQLSDFFFTLLWYAVETIFDDTFKIT